MSEPQVEAAPRPWRRSVLTGLYAWLASQIALLVVSSMSAMVLGKPTAVGFPMSFWNHWDASHYLRIAAEGYLAAPEDPAFFPLYPLLVRMLDPVLPGGVPTAGLIVAGAACLGLLIMLHRFVSTELDDAVAERTVFYLVAFPTAFFLSVGYNESLFLLLVVTALYCLRRGLWWQVGLLGALASGTRSAGVLLVVPFAFEYLRQRGFRLRAIRFDVLAGALIPGGLIAYALYCQATFGDALKFSHVQAMWGRTGATWPWVTLWEVFGRIGTDGSGVPSPLDWMSIHNTIDFTAAAGTVALLVLCVVGPWKLRKDQLYIVLYGAMSMALALFTPILSAPNPLPGIGRYVIEIVPAFLILAKIGANRTFERFYLLAGISLQALLFTRYLNDLWAG